MPDRLSPEDVAAIARAVADELDRRHAARSFAVAPRSLVPGPKPVDAIGDYATIRQPRVPEA